MMSTEVPPDPVQQAQPQAMSAPAATHFASGLFWPQIQALVAKEYSELVMWFICLGVPYAGALVYVIWDGRNNLTQYLTGSDVTPFVVAAIACPAIALLLGGYQFLNDCAPDIFPFAIHRPISRSRIFLVKTCVGLVTYLATVGVPSLCALIWISIGSNLLRVQNEWLFWAIPITVMTGLLFYFVGVLLVTRKVKWYGTLWLPVVWPLIAMFLILSIRDRDHSWFMICAYVIAALPLFLAARSNFITQGQIRSQPWLARFSLAVLIGTGIGLLLSILWFAAFAALREVQTLDQWTESLVLKDGTIVQAVAYPDVSTVRYLGWRKPTGSMEAELINLPEIDHLVMLRGAKDFRFDLVFDRVLVDQWRRHPNAHHLIVHGVPYEIHYADMSTFITLVDPQTKEPRGVIGANGVEFGAKTPSREFDGPFSAMRPFGVITPEAIYAIDHEDKLVPVFRPPDGMPIRQRSITFYYGQENPSVNNILVATSHHLYKVRTTFDRFTGSVKAELLRGLPLHHNDCAIVVMQDQDRIIALRYDWPRGSGNASQLVRLNPAGLVMDHQSVPASETKQVYGVLVRISHVALFASVPLGVTLWSSGQRWFHSYWYGIVYPGAGDTLALVVNSEWGIIVGLAAAVAMWLVMSRYYFSRGRKLLWCALAFFGGPAVLLLRVAIVPKRVLESCPDCRKRRPVELANCPHCHKPWPQPERDGREIFA